jgi:hypothetical protein
VNHVDLDIGSREPGRPRPRFFGSSPQADLNVDPNLERLGWKSAVWSHPPSWARCSFAKSALTKERTLEGRQSLPWQPRLRRAFDVAGLCEADTREKARFPETQRRIRSRQPIRHGATGMCSTSHVNTGRRDGRVDRNRRRSFNIPIVRAKFNSVTLISSPPIHRRQGPCHLLQPIGCN